MTTQEAKSKFISWLQAQIGYHEGDNNYLHVCQFDVFYVIPVCDLWHQVRHKMTI